MHWFNVFVQSNISVTAVTAAAILCHSSIQFTDNCEVQLSETYSTFWGVRVKC